MKVLEISTRKGGAGVTTVACAIALALYKKNPDRVLLVDTSENGECFPLLGYELTSQKSPISVGGSNLSVISAPLPIDIDPTQYDFMIVDAGKTSVATSYLGETPLRVAVVRNAYLYLRAHTHSKMPADAVVSLHHQGHALTHGDVENVLQTYVFKYPVTDGQARSIDAGLFVSRSNLWEEWAENFIERNALSNISV